MKNQLITALLFYGPAFFSVSAFSQAQTKKGTSVVATVNDRKITLDEFNTRYEQNSALIPGRAPDKPEVLKQIVYFELAVQEARRQKIHLDAALKEQFDLLLYQALLRRNVQPKIDALDVSEADVKKYYEKNPLIRTSHIILLTKPGMTADESKQLRTQAEKILAQVKEKKKGFEELARQYSEGPSAKTGGDVDWGARHKLLPEYYEAALALKNIGDTTDVIETPYGMHIIKLTGKQPFAKLDAVYRDFIIRTLRENKGQSVYTDYFEDLKGKPYNKVVVSPELLN